VNNIRKVRFCKHTIKIQKADKGKTPINSKETILQEINTPTATKSMNLAPSP